MLLCEDLCFDVFDGVYLAMQPLYYLWRMVYVVYSFKKGEAPAKRDITNIEAYIIPLAGEVPVTYRNVHKHHGSAGRRVAIDYKR